jgi:hypothetical protein
VKRELTYLFFVIVFFALVAGHVQAASITVDGSTCTLFDAITAANTNANVGGCIGSEPYGDDTIFLATDILLAASLPEIVSTVTIEGKGYTIDGNNDSAVGSVLSITAGGDLTLNEITITGGYYPNGDGGGIYNEGTLTLNNSTVSENSTYASAYAYASAKGGGIYNYNGPVTLNNSTVSGNSTYAYADSSTASAFGGGIYNFSGTVTLSNSTVSGNSTYAADATATAKANGGGISNETSGTVTLNNSTVSGNSTYADAVYDYAFGGGIYNDFATVTLNNSTVSGNFADTHGGGFTIDSAAWSL